MVPRCVSHTVIGRFPSSIRRDGSNTDSAQTPALSELGHARREIRTLENQVRVNLQFASNRVPHMVKIYPATFPPCELKGRN